MPSPADQQALESEEEAAQRVARAHEALAAAQDRSYWLDRWQIDLNALMRRRGSNQLRASLRAARGLHRFALRTKRSSSDRLRALRSPLVGSHDEPVPFGDAPGSNEFHRSVPPQGPPTAPGTDMLFERLSRSEVEAVEAALAPDERALLDQAGEADRRRLLLSFGVHHQVPGVTEATGLTAAAPPADVHAMGRGAPAAGGSAYYGDIVMDGVSAGGFELADGMSALDFGCSSGRVVRALHAAYPQVSWYGCDPIDSAVAWAQEHLPGIDFLQSPEQPPLPYGDGQFHLVYAVSIWSHFAEPAALKWLGEMHRIIQPGGVLAFSTHGLQSVAHAGLGSRGAEQLNEVQRALYSHGFWFKDEFGEDRDHGVGDAEWGTSFLTTEWLARHAVGGSWRLVNFAPGRLERNQDLYVLERR